MTVDWSTPAENGLAIESYRIVIKTSITTFEQDLMYCDGSDTNFVSATTCTIPLDTLTSAPFNLQLGEAITAKVSAINSYGDSGYS
jgi:hypothetical protein